MNILNSRHARQYALRTVFCLVCCTSTSAFAVGKDAGLEVVSGKMTRLQGQWVTKSKTAELGLPGGGRIYFHNDTEARALTDPQSLAWLPGKKTPTYSIILRRGLIDIDVPNENPERIAVAVGTPTQVRMVTLSGQSSIKVVGRDVIVVCHSGLTTISQGTTLVRLPVAVKRVYQVQGGFVDRPLIDAPRWVGGRRVWIANTGTSVPISGYTWAPVEGASGYIVSLREFASRRTITQEHVSLPMVESFQQPLGPGKYELDVAAIDNDGVPSRNRIRLPVTVVGLDVPGGAVVLPNNTVMIGAEQQVRLTYADGLTLTNAAHESGVAGTEPFGLEGLDRASILIHPPGGGDTSTLTLVRREPLVSTWVGPKLASWPNDPIDLQVSFVDGRGTPTPRSIEPTVRVLVGVDVVEPAWHKQSSFWRAQLPPMKGGGPWVVRLEVFDQHGVIIGRDFVEISKTRIRPLLAGVAPNTSEHSRRRSVSETLKIWQ